MPLGGNAAHATLYTHINGRSRTNASLCVSWTRSKRVGSDLRTGALLISVASHRNDQSMLHESTVRAIGRGLTPLEDKRHTLEQLMESAPHTRTKHKSAYNFQGKKGVPTVVPTQAASNAQVQLHRHTCCKLRNGLSVCMASACPGITRSSSPCVTATNLAWAVNESSTPRGCVGGRGESGGSTHDLACRSHSSSGGKGD